MEKGSIINQKVANINEKYYTINIQKNQSRKFKITTRPPDINNKNRTKKTNREK